MTGIRTPIAAVKIKHANHYTIGPSVHPELCTPRIQHNVYFVHVKRQCKFLGRMMCRMGCKIEEKEEHIVNCPTVERSLRISGLGTC